MTSETLLSKSCCEVNVCFRIFKGDGITDGSSSLRRTQSHRLIPHPESQFEAATPDWIDVYKHPLDEDVSQPEEVFKALASPFPAQPH